MSSPDGIDRLVIRLRAYAAPSERRVGKVGRAWTSGISVIFDTETTTDPSQRLRFAAYQVRDRGDLLERGLFYADDLSAADLETVRTAFGKLQPTEAGEAIKLRTLEDFVSSILFGWGYACGGLIVGFNLPYDLSRLASEHTYAKRGMKGGFSFTLAEGRPNLRIKHLSQRASFIDFAGKDGYEHGADKGHFLDVKTLAAVITSQSHSLESLTRLLGTPTQKTALDDYNGPLTAEFVGYALADVQATWESFDALVRRYKEFGLSADICGLYSEASLGKAFLAEMGVKPWLEVQPDFPRPLIGQIMSAYFGGRAEVRIRRTSVPVLHCDFLSMYPTVCTLMGPWRFVIASGVNWTDATAEVRQFIENCTLADLRQPETWRLLTCLVQVQPADDIFPVRARYEPDQPATIGLNRFSAPQPMWFTLADVLASKLLRGKTPAIVSAIRFAVREPQSGLRTLAIEGERFDPASGDFYKTMIERRQVLKGLAKTAAAGEKPRLEAAQQALKILANSTSYGIFVELNVQRLDRATFLTIYDFQGKARRLRANKREEPGRYFHPLIGTLITGAARLMLALAERNALDQGLGWAFCDTDSLAIANVAELPGAEFVARVQNVRAYFETLNPYAGGKGSILQLEKVNYPPDRDGDEAALRPTNCYAISAKRYGLFDRDEAGSPAIRKASAHGLGHLVAPYLDPDRRERIGRIGVEKWQEDLWLEIIRAAEAGTPNGVEFSRLQGFDQPAASRYSANNQVQFGWFRLHNERVAPSDRVRPFNFLTTYQAKSLTEIALTDPEAALNWKRRIPQPVSAYARDPSKDQPPIFDRRTGTSVPRAWLKSIARSLLHYPSHPESKFLGGGHDERGELRRRNVQAVGVVLIGKEADDLEQRETLGEGDQAVEWGEAGSRKELIAGILDVLVLSSISDTDLWTLAQVSHHTLADLKAGRRIPPDALFRLASAAERLRKLRDDRNDEATQWREMASQIAGELGSVSALARQLRVTRQYLGRVLKGQRSMTAELMERISALRPNRVSS